MTGQKNPTEKLNTEIRWLASHTDQAHPIPGKTLVTMTRNGVVRNFYGEALLKSYGTSQIWLKTDRKV